MKPFNAVIVPVGGPAQVKTLHSWEELVEAVGKDCPLERIDLGRISQQTLVGYVDEDGIAKKLPRNEPATVYVKGRLAQSGRSLLPNDFIKGTIAFLAEDPRDEDNLYDAPKCVVDYWSAVLGGRTGAEYFFSERHMPLVYWREPATRLNVPVLTVENYCKWYTLYLVCPDGVVEPIDFPDEAPGKEIPFLDHVPNPRAVKALAEKRGWHVDSQAFEMIVGRWEVEAREGYDPPEDPPAPGA